MSATVEKVVLKIGDKEISLSIEEAKQLKGILSDLFGKKEIQYTPYPVVEKIPYYPRPWYEYDKWNFRYGLNDNIGAVYYSAKAV